MKRGFQWLGLVALMAGIAGASKPLGGTPPTPLSGDSSNVRLVGSWPFGPAECADFDAFRSVAYLASGSGVVILDVSNPSAPAESASVTLPERVRALAYYMPAHLLLVADGGHGLYVLDVSDPWNPQIATTLSFPDTVNDVTVAGFQAFVAARSAGLFVVDLSTPSSPTVLGQYNTPGLAWRVDASDSYAFVADRGGGLRIVDVSNPSAPVEVGALDTPGDARDVSVWGTLAFIADGPEGLRIVDVYNPSAPSEVGHATLAGITYSVVANGTFAYTTNGQGLEAWDVSTPSAPQMVKFYDAPGWAVHATLAGGYLYLSARDAGLLVLDMTDPSGVQEVGNYPGDQARPIFVSGHYAYIGLSGSIRPGLQIVDISDPSNPQEVGFVSIPNGDFGNEVYDIYASGKYVYFCYMYAGFSIIYVSDPSNPIEVSSDNPDWSYSIFSDRNYLYVGTESGLYIYDISDPSNPVEIGSIYNNNFAVTGIFVLKNYAYLGCVNWPNYSLRILNISDPTNPQEVGVYDLPNSPNNVFISGNLAYVADGQGGLRIIDVSDPTNPQEVGHFDTPNSASEVYASGNYAFVAVDDLYIVDVSDPTNPQQVGIYDIPGDAAGVFVSGNYAYVADWNSGLRILQIADPDTLRWTGTYQTPGEAHGIALGQNYAFLATGLGGLLIFDLSNPSQPIGSFNTPGSAQDVFVDLPYAYVADYGRGLRILDVSDPANPSDAGYYDTQGRAYDVAGLGNDVYVADGSNGFSVLHFYGAPVAAHEGQTPETTTRLQVLSSPAHDALVLRVRSPQRTLSFALYDVQGRVVHTYTRVPVPRSGRLTLPLENLATGVYFLQPLNLPHHPIKFLHLR